MRKASKKVLTNYQPKGGTQLAFDFAKAQGKVVINLYTKGASINTATPFLKESVTVFFTFNPIHYSVFGSVRKETQLPPHFFLQDRRPLKAHPPPKLE